MNERASAQRGPEARPTSELLTRTEAALYLGWKQRTFDRRDADGLIPRTTKIGRCKFWHRLELDAWLIYGAPPRAEWSLVWQRIRKSILEARAGAGVR